MNTITGVTSFVAGDVHKTNVSALNNTDVDFAVDTTYFSLEIGAQGGVITAFFKNLTAGVLSMNYFQVSDDVNGGGLSSWTTYGNPVPGPIVGAGLPGLLAACGALFALARRRRQQRVA
jgi:hypothetical protein